MRSVPFMTSFFTLASLSLSAVPAAADPNSRLPGPDGGYDYASVDAAAQRLYVARSTSVTVYDLKNGAAPRSIGALAHGHAVVPLPGGKELLVTSGGDDSVRFIAIEDGRELARIAVGHDPDAAVLHGGRAYVMNAKDGTVSVIDVEARKLVGSASLKPGLEFAAVSGDMLFVNNEDANEIETLDLKTLKPGRAIALPGCTGPSGLALDHGSDRLVSACDNGKAAVVSLRAMRLETLLPIGTGPDAVLMDEAGRRAFIPSGQSGQLDEISLPLKGPAQSGQRIMTEAGARTGAIDPASGTAYLPFASFAPPRPGERRGAMIPGSFAILVVGLPK